MSSRALARWFWSPSCRVQGASVVGPGPGHSVKDASLIVTPSTIAPDGFLVHSYAGAELWQKGQSHERKRALCSWADALRSQKHYNEAAGKYQEALGIDPAEAYNGLGNVLVEQERFDEAIEQYRKADKLWRKDQSKERKRALWNWANALRLKKDYEKAANKFQEALDVDPEYLDAWKSFHRTPGRF